jgi:hypothetical protein
MKRYKTIISICLLILTAVSATAQSSSNSPYTRYGFGQLSDQSFGNSKAMGGIAYGLRNGLHINASNPASYSAVDSLTFILDAGMSLQNANFKEGNIKTNAKNSTFDYIAMQFRLVKGLGLTAGFLPYSTVGYNMQKISYMTTNEFGNKISSITTFKGNGGLQQVFIGLGYQVFKNLSVGANLSYLYGDLTHSASTAFNYTEATSSVRADQISIRDYKLDFGMQYTQNFGEKHAITLGGIYSLGHDMNGDGYKFKETYNYNSTIQSQTVDTISNAFSLPTTWGIGATYVYDERLTIGLDYTHQNWADIKFYNQKDAFQNRKKISVGAEYLPNPVGRNYFNRIRYRVGAYYSDPYAKVNGMEGAREYGASFGFGLPLHLYHAKTILNISGQYVKVSPKTKGLLEENYLRINIGLTFNERWFAKFRVD